MSHFYIKKKTNTHIDYSALHTYSQTSVYTTYYTIKINLLSVKLKVKKLL